MLRRRMQRDRLMKRLFLTLGVLIVALVVVLIIILASGGAQDIEEKQAQLKESGAYLQGISIEGVDVSGLSYTEAATNEQIRAAAQDAVDSFTYAFTVNGKEYSYKADELGITSDLDRVLETALYFGQVGSDGAQMREQKAQAKDGVDFPLAVYADEQAVLAKITQYKAEAYDALPQDATVEIPDDIKGDADAEFLDELDGVTIVPEVAGVDVDAAKLTSMICTRINSQDYSEIEAPVIVTQPQIDEEMLKENTQLMSTYKTSFADGSEDDPDRVNNIVIMAGFVNGAIIKPGETWSINDTAGPRNEKTAETVGWSIAPGITNGRSVDQVGGGVCQVSGTLYNAAILAEMEIVERHVHSWPSAYIVGGLDATISTDGPDLKLANPYDMPIYMVACVDQNKKTLTVQIYGPPLSQDYTIRFVSTMTESIPAPETVYHYDATTLPDGTAIAAGKSVTWVKSRSGETWVVYKQYLDADGNVVKSSFFSEDEYDPFTGEVYVNGPDPAAAPVSDDQTTG